MANSTSDQSMILSVLLEAVVGTQKTIKVRQDYCRLHDCLKSMNSKSNTYFTGSKSEGLELPDSDEDYMYDLNNIAHVRVTQSLDEICNDISPDGTFYMSTENVPPGFALLQFVPQSPMNTLLYLASQYIFGTQYLSSDLFTQIIVSAIKNIPVTNTSVTARRQGPSAELWSIFCDKSKSGADNVYSIHCASWPNEASEWTQRLRYYGWPTSQDILTITKFGFHLVPIGHPHSDTKLMEWRISFSVAERTLVWSFNHVQIQCYAVMKIILKEFIKVRCNPQNQILCSYFIKTFLFWKYESTDLNFWRADNFRKCLKQILVEFSKCVQEGVLRHYFIPRFNLLSVKLIPAAQRELLQLFDIVIQSDIRIFKECRTLHNVWSQFLVQVPENRNNLINDLKRENLLKNNKCIAWMVDKLFDTSQKQSNVPFNKVIRQISSLSCKSQLKTLTLRTCLLEMQRSAIHTCSSGNKGMYELCRKAQNDIYAFDISSSKLWCAILLYMKGFTSPTLNIVNQVLSSIPPYVMYQSVMNQASSAVKQLYVDMFLDSDFTTIQRARRAWMFDLIITQEMIDVVPLAIKLELYANHVYVPVTFSPFACAYYLQFLCYHRMHQYDSRDRALQQLIEVANNEEQCGNILHHSLNIAGHCLLLAGRRNHARDIFRRSYLITQMVPPYDKFNSALWYLRNCF